jgi:hypothetical protein
MDGEIPKISVAIDLLDKISWPCIRYEIAIGILGRLAA